LSGGSTMTIQPRGNGCLFPPRRTCIIARLLVAAIVLGPLGSTAFGAEDEPADVPSDGRSVCTQVTFSLAAHEATRRSQPQFRCSIERAARQLSKQIDSARGGMAVQQDTNRRSVKSGALIGAAIGAGAGAVGGAMAGARTGEERAPAYGAAVFAAVGALTGAAIGAIIAAARD
jgi:hypothetical protein